MYYQDSAQVGAANARAKKSGNGGHLSVSDWREIKKRYGYTCVQCHRTEPGVSLTIDHIVPLSKGGRTDASNIQPLCHRCNDKKRTAIVDYRGAVSEHALPPTSACGSDKIEGNHCCVCNRGLSNTGWVCRKCEDAYGLAIPYVRWPEWAKELKRSEQAQRRYNAQWGGKLESFIDDATDDPDVDAGRPHVIPLDLPTDPYASELDNREYRRANGIPE